MTVQVPFPRPVETAGVLVDEGQEGGGGGGGQVGQVAGGLLAGRLMAGGNIVWEAKGRQALRAIETFT